MSNPNRNKFAFFGTPNLATVFLDDLEHAGLVPSIVVTVPDKPQGRRLQSAPPPTKLWAEERTIPVLQPEVYDRGATAALRAAAADFFLVIYYGKVLPPAILEIPKHGVLNIHYSLLPRWRGTSPVRAAILNDDRELGTSIILLDEKLDHGPVLAQKKIAVPEWPPRASDAEKLLTHLSAKLLLEILPSYLAGDIEAHQQNHDIATACPHYTKTDGLLDLNGDAYQNLLKVRGFDTTVGTHAIFERNGKRIFVQILDAHIEGKKFVIDKVKPESKREMTYAEFLRSGAKPA